MNGIGPDPTPTKTIETHRGEILKTAFGVSTDTFEYVHENEDGEFEKSPFDTTEVLLAMLAGRDHVVSTDGRLRAEFVGEADVHDAELRERARDVMRS